MDGWMALVGAYAVVGREKKKLRRRGQWWPREDLHGRFCPESAANQGCSCDG
jgi:hypothetical protein